MRIALHVVAQGDSVDDVEPVLFTSVTSNRQHGWLDEGTNEFYTVSLKSF
jgi:hypothetical protein